MDDEARISAAKRRAGRVGYSLRYDEGNLIATNVLVGTPQRLGNFSACSSLAEAFEMAAWKLERISSREEPWPS